MSEVSTKDIRVVILAGGKGTRLKPFTNVFPKPLVPLGDKPIIEILLRRLSRFGFRNVTLCVGHLRGLIMAVCGDGSQFGLSIDYSYEDGPLGTAAPLANVPNRTDPIIVMNGDLLTTLDFHNILRFHQEQRADLTIGVYRRDIKIDLGVVESDEMGRFSCFHEKPVYHFEVSMGVNIISAAAMRHVEPGKYLDMPDLVLKTHGAGGCVRCYREECYWLDIGRVDDYTLAQEHFEQNQAMFLGDNT